MPHQENANSSQNNSEKGVPQFPPPTPEPSIELASQPKPFKLTEIRKSTAITNDATDGRKVKP